MFAYGFFLLTEDGIRVAHLCLEYRHGLSRSTSSPRGDVAAATKIRPGSAHARRYSTFSVTFAWMKVSPERYQTTGRLLPGAWTGTKTENVISVPVLVEACL